MSEELIRKMEDVIKCQDALLDGQRKEIEGKDSLINGQARMIELLEADNAQLRAKVMVLTTIRN